MGNILFQSSYALLTYIKKSKTLMLEWKGKCTEDEYKDIFLEAAKIGESNIVHFFLSDFRNGGPVSYSNLLWLIDTIIPKAINIGVKKVGLIFNEELFSTIYADSIKAGFESCKIDIDYFSNQNDVINWFSTHIQLEENKK